MFFTKISKSSPLPISWPSPLHNKCKNPNCYYPNAPQPVEGKYNCQGRNNGYPCSSTYKVTAARAREVCILFAEQFQKDDEVKRKAAEKRKREEEWLQRRKEATRRIKEKMDLRPGAEQQIAQEGRFRVKMYPGVNRRPGLAMDNQDWTYATKEQEYHADQIRQLLHPNRRVTQRWI